MKFEDYYGIRDITDECKAQEYDASTDVFKSLLHEVKELSKKKPDATMSKAKVKIVNRVLGNLLIVLEGQPDAKYLESLDDDDLRPNDDLVRIDDRQRLVFDHDNGGVIVCLSEVRCHPIVLMPSDAFNGGVLVRFIHHAPIRQIDEVEFRDYILGHIAPSLLVAFSMIERSK
jgi:hypothetical protein